MTQSPTTRSKARYARASAVLAPVTLDREHAEALRRLQTRRGLSAAALVRALLLEAAGKLRTG